MNERPVLGFIGAGNMARALIKGLVQSGIYEKDQLLVSDKEKAAVEGVSSLFGMKGYTSNKDLVRDASLVILSVKPQNMRDVLEEVRDNIRHDHLLISIAAGIPLSMIHTVIKKDIPLIRVMPNTPALVQKGISALAGNAFAGPMHVETAKSIFDAVGDTVEVEEVMMDAVTALSGSGPGYVFRIMECMLDAGVSVGLDRDISTRLVIQTFLGAAHLAKESNQSLSGLREMVTSPGGTTAQGLAAFDAMGLDKMVIEAVQAACSRSIELGKNFA